MKGYKGTIFDLQTGLYALFNGAFNIDATKIAEVLRKGIITTGVGKSGYVARKVASTFATYGISSQFVHPTEGAHGEFGGVHKDIMPLVWFSASGKTPELEAIVRYFGAYIGITCCREPELPSLHTIVIPDLKEDVPVIVPALMQVVGDGLAREAAILNGWSPDDLKWTHPANRT